jgi:hypothetical protein
MYLKCHRQFKDGKEHRYWSIAEKQRCVGGRMVDRHVLYLGEINYRQTLESEYGYHISLR